MEAAVEMAVVAGQVVEQFRSLEHGCAEQLELAFVSFPGALWAECFLMNAGPFDAGGHDGGFDTGEASRSFCDQLVLQPTVFYRLLRILHAESAIWRTSSLSTQFAGL